MKKESREVKPSKNPRGVKIGEKMKITNFLNIYQNTLHKANFQSQGCSGNVCKQRDYLVNGQNVGSIDVVMWLY